MVAAAKSLLSFTAEDLMTKSPVLIPRAMSLRGAARILSRSAVTGAPVVDNKGHCVGVLSATDFLSWAENGDRAAKQADTAPCSFFFPWQVAEIEELPADDVGKFMTADVVTTGPTTGIGELARMMTDAHIHRVIVVDENETPIGVVSSTDILAAVSRIETAAESVQTW